MYLQSIKENIHVSWVSTRSLCRENNNNYQSLIIKKILNNIKYYSCEIDIKLYYKNNVNHK